MTLGLYLAGPDVFLADAAAVLAAKSDLVRAAGFTPLTPGDADVPRHLPPLQQGEFISGVDEGLMTRADAAIVNLTPFRGISADAGTAYELGFLAASGKPVFCYTNDARSYFDRVSADRLTLPLPDGSHRDAQGQLVENFDMIDNLMLHGGASRRGHPVVIHDGKGRIDDLGGFRAALAQAVAALS